MAVACARYYCTTFCLESRFLHMRPVCFWFQLFVCILLHSKIRGLCDCKVSLASCYLQYWPSIYIFCDLGCSCAWPLSSEGRDTGL